MEFIDKIINKDALAGLKELPDNSIDSCVTSPPYYQLRDYMWEGQIGKEHTPEEYIKRLTDVFVEVKRVLKPQGTLWLNIGDSYNGSGGNHKDTHKNDSGFQGNIGVKYGGKGAKVDELKPKDLIGIPWMLAFSLRDAGYYLRQDIIWSKGNPMPEPVKDRCVKSNEYIFLMSKSPKYYFDYEAIMEPCADQTRKNYQSGSRSNGINKDRNDNDLSERSKTWQPKKMPKFGGNKYGNSDDKHFQTYSGKEWKPRTNNVQYDGQQPNTMHLRREQGYAQASGQRDNPGGGYGANAFVRNKRDVWSVNTKPDNVAHFATYPEKLIEPCILAGCPKNGIVLDPFMGSGTTAKVAQRFGRHYVGFELNPEYIKIAERKLRVVQQELFV